MARVCGCAICTLQYPPFVREPPVVVHLKLAFFLRHRLLCRVPRGGGTILGCNSNAEREPAPGVSTP